MPPGESLTQDVTFNVGLYDGAAAASALTDITAYGYNTARVFLNGACATGCLGDTAAADDPTDAYLANGCRLPGEGSHSRRPGDRRSRRCPGRHELPNQVASGATAEFAGENLHYLTAGGVGANASFWAALVQRLTAQESLRETILAYELRREAHFRADQAPLTLSSGTVTAANGETYDLAVAAQRQALMDEGLVHWSNTIRSAIRGVDPTALVSLGFLWPQSPNVARIGDPRITRMRAVPDDSAVDFVSPRVVPGLELTFRSTSTTTSFR